jgi:chromosome segregation ATPase
MPNIEKPVRYAEGVLGVHDVWDAVVQNQNDYEEAMQKHDELVAQVHTAEETIANLEADFTIEERAANPDMSATAFEKHIKSALQLDAEMQEWRRSLAAKKHERDKALTEVESYKSRVRVGIARLEELGGLLHFYAARTPPPKP